MSDYSTDHRATVQFEDDVSPAFVDLVAQTLQESAFIDVESVGTGLEVIEVQPAATPAIDRSEPDDRERADDEDTKPWEAIDASNYHTFPQLEPE